MKEFSFKFNTAFLKLCILFPLLIYFVYIINLYAVDLNFIEIHYNINAIYDQLLVVSKKAYKLLINIFKNTIFTHSTYDSIYNAEIIYVHICIFLIK